MIFGLHDGSIESSVKKASSTNLFLLNYSIAPGLFIKQKNSWVAYQTRPLDFQKLYRILPLAQ